VAWEHSATGANLTKGLTQIRWLASSLPPQEDKDSEVQSHPATLHQHFISRYTTALGNWYHLQCVRVKYSVRCSCKLGLSVK